jgi:hypothetical protein
MMRLKKGAGLVALVIVAACLLVDLPGRALQPWSGATTVIADATAPATQQATVDSSGNLHTTTAAITGSLPSGSNVIGFVNLQPAIFSGNTFTSIQVANNTTAIIIKGSAGNLNGLEFSNNSVNDAYIKIYNAASGITCGTGTVVKRYLIPGAAVASAAGVTGSFVYTFGLSFSNGITMCVTSLYADSDTTAPAANAYTVDVIYK